VADLEQAAKLAGQPAPIIAALGMVYFDKENYKQARLYFDKSSALDPNEEGGYFGRAAILIEEKNYLAAINEIDKLLKVQLKNAQALFRRVALLKASNPQGSGGF
jgi:tetratricopeptide (TPR) repeat protein